MNQLLRRVATTASALSIAGGGLTGVAAASSASTQGPNSPIKIREHNHLRVHNDNNVNLNNTTTQSASTGDANVKNNTTGGNARSGNASNSSALSASITVNNRNSNLGGSGGSHELSTEGPNSPIRVKSSNSTHVSNDNNITVNNTTSQTATSGDAKVSNNTTGGSATSGNASNSSSTTVHVNVTN